MLISIQVQMVISNIQGGHFNKIYGHCSPSQMKR